MANVKVEKYVCGSVQTNCYFLINEDTSETVIIDPAENAPALKRQVEQKKLKPVAILLTHGHYDHMLAADELRKEYDIEIMAHEEEKQILESANGNLSDMIGMNYVLKADRFLKDKEMLTLAGISMEVLHTPGHTIGGCCYYLKEQGVVFCGDTLFQGSVGRTDFPTGSMSALVRSIKKKLLVLPGDTVALPGHDRPTNIEYEKMNNPFL